MTSASINATKRESFSKAWDKLWDNSGTNERLACPRPLIAVGQAYEVPWTLADWRAFHDERFAIRLYDGGLPEAEVARKAWLDCIARWLERHPSLGRARHQWDGTSEEFRLCRIQDAEFCLTRLGL